MGILKSEINQVSDFFLNKKNKIKSKLGEKYSVKNRCM